MKPAEMLAVLLAVGLVASLSVNILQSNLNNQLLASLSEYNKPLVLSSYSMTDEVITLVLWNQGADQASLINICDVNGWPTSALNLSAPMVPPNCTATVTIFGPIECRNATYDIRIPYHSGSDDYILKVILPRGEVVYEPAIPLAQAIAAGREFLDSWNYTTGQVLSTALTVLQSNNYFHNIFGIENNAQPGFQHCWAIKFEKACCPGHLYEVFVNSETGEVIGGIQCK